MHAAFAADAVQIVKQTVKTSSFLGMNAPVRSLIGLLHVTLPPGMNADYHPRHRNKAVGPATGNSLGAGGQPRRASGLKN